MTDNEILDILNKNTPSDLIDGFATSWQMDRGGCGFGLLLGLSGLVSMERADILINSETTTRTKIRYEAGDVLYSMINMCIHQLGKLGFSYTHSSWACMIGEDDMKESDIQRRILDYINSLEKGKAYKVLSANERGCPDILACYKGMFLALEVKQENGKPSAIQKAQLEKIKWSGGYSGVVYSLDEVKQLISVIDSVKGD
jgi:hypothetical protein